jgi:hypothetical protein
MPTNPSYPLANLFNQAPQKLRKGVRTQSFYLTMRDGVQLAVDLLLPADLAPHERLPVILTMTRYWRAFELRVADPPNQAPIAPREPLAEDLVKRGFAMLLVDGRGSGASTGSSPYPWSPDELADYGEVAQWAAAQPWCNGKVGAVGISYEGSTALLLAGTGVPEVQAAAPQEIEFDVYTDIAFPGGILNEAFMRAWSEGNRMLDSNKLPKWFPIPMLARWMLKGVRPVDSDRKTRVMLAQALADHQSNTDVLQAMTGIIYRDDPFGQSGVTLDEFSVFSQRTEIEASGCPIFSWGSWLDGATADTVVRMYNNFSNPQVAVIGAWAHEKTTHGSPYLPPKSQPNPPQAEQWAALAQFFEQTLRRGEPLQGKQLFYYTLGAESWRQSNGFPPANSTLQSWYFQPGNLLAPTPPSAPSAENEADEYRVDFEATTGTNNRWHTQLAKPLVYPDRAAADRHLLTYTSAPLEADLEITGYPEVTLYLASTATDGAFFAYLEEVDEAGMVRYLSEGMLRGLHRNLSEAPPPYTACQPYRTFKRGDAAPLPPGETVELTFSLLPVSALVRRGHRLRLALAGADKDTFARIPVDETPTWKVSRTGQNASCVRLPVVRLANK